MTEAEWLACDDPQTMVVFLGTDWRERTRKRRLFACACVRRIWHLLPDERSRDAVEAAERSPETEQNDAFQGALDVYTIAEGEAT
jgi:hypothetical protein